MNYKGIELRGENLVKAVLEGTNANAHLVARNGLLYGIHETAEQYHIDSEKVLLAIKFYLNNRDEIDEIYHGGFEQSTAWKNDEFIEELKRRKASKQLSDS